MQSMFIIIAFVFCLNAMAKKKLNRLSKDSRKLQSYVPSRLSKIVPKSSNLKNMKELSTHKISLRFEQKIRKPIVRTRNVNCSIEIRLQFK